jgi:hypothetical protein
VSVGGHAPRYRLSGKVLGAVWGGGGAVERAVANYDEDSLAMCCEAVLNALNGRDLKSIGARSPPRGSGLTCPARSDRSGARCHGSSAL